MLSKEQLELAVKGELKLETVKNIPVSKVTYSDDYDFPYLIESSNGQSYTVSILGRMLAGGFYSECDLKISI
jgi:hypothetical protein